MTRTALRQLEGYGRILRVALHNYSKSRGGKGLYRRQTGIMGVSSPLIIPVSIWSHEDTT